MAHPGRPRKSGARHPNGRLCWTPRVDHGHELTLAHRAETLAGADPKDQRASFPLGILALRGDLADPGIEKSEALEQNHLRLMAGLKYGHDHAVVWRGDGAPNPSPPSHSGSFVPSERAPPTDFDLDDDDPDANYRRRSRQLRGATARVLVVIDGGRALRVLDNIVVYNHRMRFMDTSNRRPPSAWAADERDKASLRLALGALVREYKLEARRPGAR